MHIIIFQNDARDRIIIKAEISIKDLKEKLQH